MRDFLESGSCEFHGMKPQSESVAGNEKLCQAIGDSSLVAQL
jgi:hypothetical protein